MEPRILLRTPLPHTWPVLNSPARFKLPVCGRRWTKTTVCTIAAIDGHGPVVDGVPMWRGVIHGANVWWVVPTYALASVVWEGEPGRPGVKELLAPVTAKVREIDRTINILPELGGGRLSVRSAEDPDTLVSQGLDGVVMDEAARISHRAWGNIRPSLADRRGWAILPSTPNSLEPSGKWYEDLFVAAGTMRDWQRWQRPTSDNPLIAPDEIEAMRNESNMTALKFQQEIMAQFVSAEGALLKARDFRYFDEEDGYFALDTGDGVKRTPIDGGRRFATMDLAVSLKTLADYTVIGAFHVTPERDLLLLDLERARMEGPDQLPALRRMLDRWHLGAAWIERTGYQLALIQAAAREGMPVRELRADKDKVSRGQPLCAMIENHKVYFRRNAPYLNVLEPELLAFPGGDHDDCWDVMAYGAQLVGQGGGAETQVFNFSRRAPITYSHLFGGR